MNDLWHTRGLYILVRVLGRFSAAKKRGAVKGDGRMCVKVCDKVVHAS